MWGMPTCSMAALGFMTFLSVHTAQGREDLRHFSPVVLPIRDYKMAQNEWFTYQDQRKGHPIWFTPSLVSSNTVLHGFN